MRDRWRCSAQALLLMDATAARNVRENLGLAGWGVRRVQSGSVGLRSVCCAGLQRDLPALDSPCRSREGARERHSAYPLHNSPSRGSTRSLPASPFLLDTLFCAFMGRREDDPSPSQRSPGDLMRENGTQQRHTNHLIHEQAPTSCNMHTIRWTGTRGMRRLLRASREENKPDLPLHRLFRLPLVPRDGARVFRERSHRRAHERVLRVHQSRSRRTP